MGTERAITDLEQALADHRAWAVRLHRRLIAGIPGLPEDLEDDAHHRCAFGRWYDQAQSQASQVLAGDADFQVIGEVHRRMHAHARALLQAPPSDMRLAHYDAFAAASEQLVAAVRGLQQSLLTRVLSLDALTGLPGRRAMDERLTLAWQQSRREGRPAALAMMDLDHFKQVNDLHGHAAGDEVLRWIGAGARSHLRAHDLVFRYGGEEFVAFLADSTLDAALGTLERMRRVLEGSTLRLRSGGQLHITASFGLAACRDGESIVTTLVRADRALYEAKRRGRNRVVCWQDGAFA